MRRAFIPAMVVLLFVALVGGPCVACFAGTHSCCTSCEHCQKPAKCAVQTAGQNQFQKAHSSFSFSLEPAGVVTASPVVPGKSFDRTAAEAPYSPPDLYLRNSVLTI